MPRKKNEIRPLSSLLGWDPSPSPREPEPAEDPVDWDSLSHAGAPSCLGPVKMPDAHFSIRVEWMHRLILQARQRYARANLVKARARARASGRKLPETPEQEQGRKDRAAAYQRHYRRMRRLAREQIKGKRLTEEERRELLEHRRRAELIKKAKARKRRRESRRAYLDSLIRDMEHRRQAKGRGPVT